MTGGSPWLAQRQQMLYGRARQRKLVSFFFFLLLFYLLLVYYTIPSYDIGYQRSHVNTFHITSAQRHQRSTLQPYNVAASSLPHWQWTPVTPHHHLLIDDVPDDASCIIWAFQLVSNLSYLTIILFTYNTGSLFFGQQTMIIATSSAPSTPPPRPWW